ncbi:MAG: thioredoxin family protein [Paraglaciecola sp.]|uniref:thioredoxin family protein n=1 Tax=Paraglaciecola sp. TaxID=1920173 RepID=UPI003297E27B
MSIRSSKQSQRPLLQKVGIGFAVVVALSVAGYWGNKTVQSYLGQSAIASTGLKVMSLPDALEVAKSTQKLVLADMSAIWCPTCRKLDKEIFSSEIVKAQIQQNYVFARIEYETPEGQIFRDTYDVEGFPTLLVLDDNANKLVQLPLVFEPQEFTNNLQKVSKAVSY